MTVTADEQLHPVSRFTNRIPPTRGGKRTAPSTIARWISNGVNTPNGRVRLRAVRLGHRWLTTESAWQEFLAAQTAAFVPANASTSAGPIRSPAARNKASEAAARELEKMGC